MPFTPSIPRRLEAALTEGTMMAEIVMNTDRKMRLRYFWTGRIAIKIIQETGWKNSKYPAATLYRRYQRELFLSLRRLPQTRACILAVLGS